MENMDKNELFKRMTELVEATGEIHLEELFNCFDSIYIQELYEFLLEERGF